ncbi:MarR family transcriptional regulator [Apilactobacillus sp. TMW 2.2459]|uniref:MarR family winged helix-turn-helix transcriptional regulator n=1 Tax=Apilactobacillus xinyiensis TaxID=2841032 RepID=UPI00200C1982|nr:MarR family transcriptional regulator [Apilactobacillus xinyiensis]MCL0312904.1 MarR family transcriptional regulator [Apilactobacillus xinyiensis]
MNNQFIKHYIQFEEDGLNPTEVSVMSHLYNYGELSIKNNWIKNGMVFVKYLRESLANQINVSKDTITRTVQALEEKGWIVAQRQRNAATVYFLPKYQSDSLVRKTQIASPENANCNQNYTDFNYLHSNTVNTGNDVQTTPVVDRVQQWAKATKQKVGLTFTSIQAIQKFCKNNVEKCKQVVRLILNARNSVAKANRLVKQPVAQFESNQNIINGLAQQLDHIFSYAVKLPQSNYAGYVTNALKAYFTAAFGLETKPVVVKPTVKTTKFNDGKKRIHEELPEWAQDGYEFKADESVDMNKKAILESIISSI